MSNNFRINEISDNIFKGNIKALANKTQKQIKEQKEDFEYELEKTISDLDNSERDSLLARLAKDSEKGEYSFFDSNGNINISKLKSIVDVKIKEIRQEELKNQNNTSIEKVNTAEKIETSKEAQGKVSKLLDEYNNLSNDEDKYKFIEKIFGADIKPQEKEVYKKQLDLAGYIKKLREEGKSNTEIQEIIDEHSEFKDLTNEQRSINEEGKTLIEVQLEVREDIELLQKQIDLIEKSISEEIDEDTKEKLTRLKKELELKKKEEKKLSEKTTVVKDRRDSRSEEYNEENRNEISKGATVIDTLTVENDLHYEGTNIDLEQVKNPEDLKQLLGKGISKEAMEEAIGIFNIALTSVEEGASKDDLQNMIKEMQEGATPETIAVLESLTNMEFDKSIEEILSSDEEKINLIEQLTEELVQIQSIEIEDKTSEKLITDSELVSAFASLEEEIEVGGVPQPEGKELTESGEKTKNEEETKETVVAVSPKVFSLMGVIKKSSSARSGEIKGQQDITKVLVTGEEEKGKEAVTVGIE